jgi:hypothetical protein
MDLSNKSLYVHLYFCSGELYHSLACRLFIDLGNFLEDLRFLKSLQLNQLTKGKATIARPDAMTKGTPCEGAFGD